MAKNKLFKRVETFIRIFRVKGTQTKKISLPNEDAGKAAKKTFEKYSTIKF